MLILLSHCLTVQCAVVCLINALAVCILTVLSEPVTNGNDVLIVIQFTVADAILLFCFICRLFFSYSE